MLAEATKIGDDQGSPVYRIRLRKRLFAYVVRNYRDEEFHIEVLEKRYRTIRSWRGDNDRIGSWINIELDLLLLRSVIERLKAEHAE